MHMADALVSPPVATGMAVASLAVGAYSIFKIKKENKPENIQFPEPVQVVIYVVGFYFLH